MGRVTARISTSRTTSTKATVRISTTLITSTRDKGVNTTTSLTTSTRDTAITNTNQIMSTRETGVNSTSLITSINNLEGTYSAGDARDGGGDFDPMGGFLGNQ